MPKLKDDPHQLLLLADILPNGHGGYTVTPKKPVEELSPKHAAKFLGISRSGIYRLIDLGLLIHSRPSPGKILITVDSLRKHRDSVRDAEYWPNLFANSSPPSPPSPAVLAS